MVVDLIPHYAAVEMARRQAYNKTPTSPGTLGEFVRASRESAGLSQEEFASLVGDGMSASDVSQLERGKVGLPKPPRMIALAKALKVWVVDLYVAAGFPEFREGLPLETEFLEPGPDGEIVALVKSVPKRRRLQAFRYLEDMSDTQDS